MTSRSSGSDGITISLSVSDSGFTTIYDLVVAQLGYEAQRWVDSKPTISAVLAPQTGTLLFKKNEVWCSPFRIDSSLDRLAELAWEGVTTKLALSSESGTILVNIILTSK